MILKFVKKIFRAIKWTVREVLFKEKMRIASIFMTVALVVSMIPNDFMSWVGKAMATQTITSCQTLNNSGDTYVFGSNFGGGTENCLTVTAQNITIDGNGYSLDGGIYGSGSVNGGNGASGMSLNVQNLVILNSHTIDLSGSSGGTSGSGGSAGNLTLVNTNAGPVNLNGGGGGNGTDGNNGDNGSSADGSNGSDGAQGAMGAPGADGFDDGMGTPANGSDGSPGDPGQNGSDGNSGGTAGNGGNGTDGGSAGNGGNGGTLTLNRSTVSSLTNTGGTGGTGGNGGNGGSGGSANGGSGGAGGPGGPGGAGGHGVNGGLDGQPGPQGPTGTNGANGSAGNTGSNGFNGMSGTNGSNGGDGTPSTIISNVSIDTSYVSTNAYANVSYNTNISSSDSISYGPTKSYEFGTTGADGYSTSHSFQLYSLAPHTLYHFSINSSPGSGNAGSSYDVTFSDGHVNMTLYHNGSGGLDNTSAWFEDSGFTIPHNAVPTAGDTGIIQAGVTVTQNSSAVNIDYGLTVQSGGYLTLGGSQTLTITSNNEASITIEAGGTLDSTNGYVNNNSSLVNNGTWINSPTNNVTTSGSIGVTTNNVTAPYSLSGTNGSALSYTLGSQTSDGGTNYNTTLSHSGTSWSSSYMPSGLILDSSTGSISGTPNVRESGTMVITSTASDGSVTNQNINYNIDNPYTTTFYHNGSGGLDDPNSWFEDAGFSIHHNALPTTGQTGIIKSGVSVTEGSGVSADYNLDVQNGGQLNLDTSQVTTLLNGSILTIENGATLNIDPNSGFNVDSGATLNINSGATFNQNIATWNTAGTLNIGNNFTIGSSTVWNIGGDLNLIGGSVLDLNTMGTLNISGSLNVSNGNLLRISADGTLNVLNGSTLTNNSTLTNDGIFTNNGGTIITGSTGNTINRNTLTYSISGTAGSAISNYLLSAQNSTGSQNYNAVLSQSSNAWSVISLPAGLSINSTTGLISGTPNASGSGSFSVTTNVSGGVATQKVGYTFSADVIPPVLSSGSPSTQQSAGTTAATLRVVTNENATCRYSTVPNTAYGSMTNVFTVTTGTTTHSTTVSGLTNGSTYNYYVRCIDNASNPNTSDYPITFSVASVSNGGGGSSSSSSSGAQTGGGSYSPSEVFVFHTNYNGTLQACSLNDLFNILTGKPCAGSNNNTSGNVTNSSGTTTIVNNNNGTLETLGTITTPAGLVLSGKDLASAGILSGFRFNKNYAVTANNLDIVKLQVFLNRAGFTVADKGYGSSGLEIKRFGPATLKALAKFQKAYGITPSIGYFGPKTRAVVNELLRKLGL